MLSFINLCYLGAAVLFIYGIKGMTAPRTAVRGNQLSAIGMGLAVVAALLDHNVIHYSFIVIGLLVGGGIGVYMARRVEMTSMPEMVAFLTVSSEGAKTRFSCMTDSMALIGISPLAMTWWIRKTACWKGDSSRSLHPGKLTGHLRRATRACGTGV